MNKGVLVLWNDDKGFGFVRPEDGEKDYFIHISAISNFKKGVTRRPMVGDIVNYYLPSRSDPKEQKGQRRLSQASIEGLVEERIAPPPKRGVTGFKLFLLNLLTSLPVLFSSYALWKTSNPIPLVSYAFMSTLTIMFYGADKKHALINKWRIPEFYLHCFELMGGWPGALLAQKEFRHKNRKSNYQKIFWGIVLLHMLAWAAFIYFHPINLKTSVSHGFSQTNTD